MYDSALCDFSNRGTQALMIIQSQRFLKTKDFQVFLQKGQ